MKKSIIGRKISILTNKILIYLNKTARPFAAMSSGPGFFGSTLKCLLRASSDFEIPEILEPFGKARGSKILDF